MGAVRSQPASTRTAVGATSSISAAFFLRMPTTAAWARARRCFAEIDPSVSLLLPCNVVVEATDRGTKVAAVDPHALMSDPRFERLAADAARRLRAAVEHVAVSRERETPSGAADR